MVSYMLVQLCFVAAVSAASLNFIPLSYMMIKWYAAEKNDDPNREYTAIPCYSEMDESMFSSDEIYRVDDSNKIEGLTCLIRVPPKSEITFRPTFHSDQSYARLISGSSVLHAPLASPKINGAEKNNNGPWHTPCDFTYLVFASGAPRRDILEFTLVKETAEDQQDPMKELCAAEGFNYATFEGLIKKDY
ncbi:hypothetical protein DdX_13783 [Ditylenchus destructor]|uniref:Uncharacterized protein n=1 Tax=Ditylenchus destructor TaxID=166010 RepID=A0AAD4QZ74_9BILA|nr:hypothetical protein DdX_13783 [Ditylenchus destructor]